MSESQQIIVVSKDHPIAQCASYEEISAYTHHPETDVNPVSIGIVSEHAMGYVALNCEWDQSDGGIYIPTHVVGYAGYSKDREFEAETYPQIGNVAVIEENQGSGLGSKLVANMLEALLSTGKEDIVTVCNHLSASIFHKLGFVEVAYVTSDSGKQKPLYMYKHGQREHHTVE